MASEMKALIEKLERRCDELMVEVQRAKEIIDRLSGSKERLYGALAAMVANESMVEGAHRKTGNPYFNSVLEKARTTLDAEG